MSTNYTNRTANNSGGTEQHDIADIARQTMGEVQQKAMDSLSDIETSIRRNPTQAVLISAGIGLLFGMILSR